MSRAWPTSQQQSTFDLAVSSIRETNARLQSAMADERFTITNPQGAHAIAVGIRSAVDVEIRGHVGYYCAGMLRRGRVHVTGNCGVAVAENLMSGRVEVNGDAGQAAAATARGGLVVIRGDASAHCAISLKGGDVVVGGNVGPASGFLAQSGRLLVCGDAGDGLGASVYRARFYIRGHVGSLGPGCIEQVIHDWHLDEVQQILESAGMSELDATDFRLYGSDHAMVSNP